MNWKDKIDKNTLEQGLQIYSFRRIALIGTHGSTYFFRVWEKGRDCQVEIDVKNIEISYMDCNCSTGKNGKYCKHMAAALYYLEYDTDCFKNMDNKNGGSSQTNTKVNPFTPASDKYVYFDLGRILCSLEVDENLLEKAESLIEEKKVTLTKFGTGYDQYSRLELLAQAEGTVLQNGQERTIYCIFDKDCIFEAKCNYMNCFGSYQTTSNTHYYLNTYTPKHKLCEHLLAFFLLLHEHLKRVNPGDATDIGGTLFLEKFRETQSNYEVFEKQDISYDFKLRPVLERDIYGIYIKVKAGTDKMLLLKNIPDFIKKYRQKDVMNLGKNYDVDFEKHCIASESEGFYNFLCNIIDESEERKEYLRSKGKYYYEEAEISGSIPLYGERIDRFFDLFLSQTIPYTDKIGRKSAKKECLLQEKKPSITLTIDRDVDEEGIFQGIIVSGKMPDFYKTAKELYYFSRTGLNRVESKMKEEICALYEVESQGEIYFTVGRRNLSEFYYDIYPKLKKIVKINESDKEYISDYIPEEPIFSFYLDLDTENHIISCKVKAQYGENEVSLIDNFIKDHPFALYRNQQKENDILRKMNRFFEAYNLERDHLLSSNWEEVAVSLLDGGIEYMMELGEVNSTERFRNMNIRRKPKIKIGISVESDMMNLSVTSDDIDNEDLLSLLKSYDRKKKYYKLRNGDIATVSEKDIELLKGMMDTMHLTEKDLLKGNMKIPVFRALYLNKMLEQSEHIYFNRDKHFKSLIKEFKTIEDCEAEVPESLSGIMRNYQVQGFKWMKTLENYGFGGILADDMGLGKTLQAISVLLSAKEKGEGSTSLIVSPASLVYNWKEEFSKYAPLLKVSLVTGTQKERADTISNYKESDVLITSYDLLKRDIAEYETAEFNYQILDEAQYIKNHSTAASKSTKVIKSRYRLALTGTPIENRLSELWSIFDYLMPGFLYGYDTFRKDMEIPIVKNKDTNISERLKKMVSPFILRRLKSNVLTDLPDKLEEVRFAKLEGEQQKLYDGQVVNMKRLLSSQKDDEFQKNKLQVLAELTKIRQICCDPSLLFEKYQGESAKKDACIELIQSAIEGEHKILVFSQFTSMLELLEQELNKLKISYYKITGETKKEKRIELVNDFNNDDTPVFLISLKAGGTGLNLTGADVVIHYDPWWNQAVQNQATDRAHRIGQTKKVTVYKLIAKGTIEEKIVKMQETKKDLADAILSGDNGGLTGMSRDELMELLV